MSDLKKEQLTLSQQRIKAEAEARQAFLENDKSRKLEIAKQAFSDGREFRKQLNERKIKNRLKNGN